MDAFDFEQALATQHKSYELLAGLNTACCEIRFAGPFNEQSIIWDASLMSLTYYMDRHLENGQPLVKARPFIEIGEITAQGRKLTVALPVLCIDEPTIIKTMIMIRQYKRLAPGRHEYGQIFRR